MGEQRVTIVQRFEGPLGRKTRPPQNSVGEREGFLIFSTLNKVHPLLMVELDAYSTITDCTGNTSLGRVFSSQHFSSGGVAGWLAGNLLSQLRYSMASIDHTCEEDQRLRLPCTRRSTANLFQKVENTPEYDQDDRSIDSARATQPSPPHYLVQERHHINRGFDGRPVATRLSPQNHLEWFREGHGTHGASSISTIAFTVVQYRRRCSGCFFYVKYVSRLSSQQRARFHPLTPFVDRWLAASRATVNSTVIL